MQREPCNGLHWMESERDEDHMQLGAEHWRTSLWPTSTNLNTVEKETADRMKWRSLTTLCQQKREGLSISKIFPPPGDLSSINRFVYRCSNESHQIWWHYNSSKWNFPITELNQIWAFKIRQPFSTESLDIRISVSATDCQCQLIGTISIIPILGLIVFPLSREVLIFIPFALSPLHIHFITKVGHI